MSAPTLTRPRPGAPAPARPEPRRGRLSLRAMERIGLAVLAGLGLWLFLAYPTYPNYDSVYSLIWGREILAGELPSFEAYRAPTQHPLAFAIGAVLSLLGSETGDRVWVLLCIVSMVALAWGLYQFGKAAFTPLVGAVAAALLVTRFDFPFLAARGYIDPGYLALVIWAAVLEIRSPRRGTPVMVLLALAGLLRPEAWLLAGLYFLWVAWPAPWRRRVWFAALTAIGPVVWALTDLIVTGNPLYSLTGTSELAAELGRNKGAGAVPAYLWAFLIKLARFPVVLGAIAGLGLGLLLTPKRVRMPLLLFAIGVTTFALVGAAGLSVIDRYLLVPSLMAMVFCGVAIAGWTMLQEGTLVRRLWAVGALALVVFGVVFTATRVNLNRLDSELRLRGDSRDALVALLKTDGVREGLRCGDVYTPNHKLVPEVRWYLDLPEDRVLARSDAEVAEPRRGVVVVVHGRAAIRRQALVNDLDEARNNLPPDGFERRAVTGYYAAYVRC